MQIKELELSGFKSFVDRVKLNFRPGITAIVGPNGCGKSNIIDAIRWIMGEHNARQLRGTKMEDLIFNGSETRKPTGMAEVSLVLSHLNGNDNGNTNGHESSMLKNVTEIMITRRLFRSGESEYYINKVPCRLRDIIEFFLDSGIGTKSYSIMEQGKVDYILSLKPEERRILIEEAAGISKYRFRKKEALSRMESTRNNLARLKDIIAELQIQMRGLDLQVKRLKRYRSLKEEIKALDLQLASHRRLTLQSERARIMQERTMYYDKAIELDTQYQAVETLLEEYRLHQVQLQSSINDVQRNYYQVKEAIKNEENTISLCLHELQTAETQIEKLTHELQELNEEISRLKAEAAVHQNQVDTAAQEIADIEKKAALSNESITSSKQTLKKVREHCQNAAQELRRIQFQKTELKNAVLLSDRLIQETHLRSQKLSSEYTANHRRTSELEAERTMREKNLHELIAKRENYEKEIQSLIARRDHATTRFMQSEHRVSEIRERYGSLQARYLSLKELQDSYEGFTDGVKHLIHEAEHNTALKNSIVCLFTDILETDPEYERALEAVLDKRVQTVIVSSWEHGMTLLDILHHKQCGRVSWVPCSPNELPLDDIPLNGVVPMATLVRVPEQYRSLIFRVLHNVFLVPSLERALELRLQTNVSAFFVTPQGDVLEPSGIVTGGTLMAPSGSLLSRSRELRTLAAEIERLEQELEAAELEKDNAFATLGHISEALSTLSAEKQHLDIAVVQESALLDQINKTLILEQKKASTIQQEMQDTASLRDSYTKEREISLAKLSELAQSETAVTAFLDDLHQQESRLVQELEHIEAAATELRIKLASVKTAYENAHTACERIHKQLSSCMTKQKEFTKDLQQYHEKISYFSNELQRSRDAVNRLAQSAQTFEHELESLRNQLAACAENIQSHEEMCKRLRVEQQEIQPKIYELDRELSSIDIHLEHLAKEVQDKYACSLNTLPQIDDPAIFNEAEIRERLDQLQKRLDNIGDVNPGAAREYEELEKRYQYLSSQEQDLMESIEALQKVITKINRVTRQKFMETFTAVNKYFQELFPVLFNGGKAYLQLTNENDLFETGIDIFVQPPGKKLQNLDLLSGGERALTVIAILFSIFLTKPTPFCLMDEIDAPLDDSNIGRFLAHLRNMAQQSQFIIVTHNKLSMQAADSLYGVTMEERGVSKIVSVALN